MRIHNPDPVLRYLRQLPNADLPKTGAHYTTGMSWTEDVSIHVGDLVGGNSAGVLRSAITLYPVAVVMSTVPFVCVSPDADMVWTQLDYASVHVVGVADRALIRRCRKRLQRDRRRGLDWNTDAGRSALWQFLHRDPQRGRNRPGWWPNWLLGSVCPDFVIGGWAKPYIYRWYIWPRLHIGVQLLVAGAGLYLGHLWPLLALLSPYLHVIVRSDDDRALHDHPSFNLSLILRGGYVEVVPDRKGMKAMGEAYTTPTSPVLLRHRRAGDIVFRTAQSQHRLVIDPMTGPAVTFFIFGPKLRDWGFWCQRGFRHWLEFTGGEHKSAEIGRGCD